MNLHPVLFSIDGIQIRYFGVLLALGLIIFYYLVRANFNEAKIRFTRNEVIDWLIIVFLYGVIGARIYYILLNFRFYFGPHADWYEFMSIWRGGLALNGGIVFAVLAFWFLSSSKKTRFEHLTDQVVAPLFIVQALVCIGQYINGEAYGFPTDKLIGLIFRYGPASKQFTDVTIHPVMLYDAILSLLGFIIINGIRKANFRLGFTTASALLWYSWVQLLTGLMRWQGLTIFGQNEAVIFGGGGILISLALIIGKRLYRRLPSPDKQFPSSRNWSI